MRIPKDFEGHRNTCMKLGDNDENPLRRGYKRGKKVEALGLEKLGSERAIERKIEGNTGDLRGTKGSLRPHL